MLLVITRFEYGKVFFLIYYHCLFDDKKPLYLRYTFLFFCSYCDAMKLFLRLLIICSTLFVWLQSFMLPLSVEASLIDNATSPFSDSWDVWAADNVSLIGTDSQKEDSLVNVVRWLVNWMLWIMWLVALLALVYWWFLMVTAAWDSEKYWKWFTILQHAAVWLILIGTAWFIASIIFRLINQAWDHAWPAWTWW